MEEEGRVEKAHESPRRVTIPNERRRGRREVEKRQDFDWLRWRDQALAGRREPTEEECLAYAGRGCKAEELKLLWARVARDRGLGEDDVSTDILIEGGAVANLALAALFTLAHRDPRRNTPKMWRRMLAVGWYKATVEARDSGDDRTGGSWGPPTWAKHMSSGCSTVPR
jgi:hypothetical protein